MANNLEESILISVKNTIGMGANYAEFDNDLLTKINMVFGILTQMGVGPATGFKIESSSNKWDEYSTDVILNDLLREYIAQKVSLLFDPPTSSLVMEAKKAYITELEYRIYVQVDSDGGFKK